jgi:glutamate synthase domain-containing protein 3
VRLSYGVANSDRSLGARLSGEIAERTRGAGLPPGTIEVELIGVAGQSLGAFLSAGVSLRLHGEAQDYVGKGMSGGEIVLRPARPLSGAQPDQVIAGNTLLYGATGGRLFAAGRVGERFCVRNSGAVAVVEGCGDHGCEYMTGGVAVVLGRTGDNFGAGMTGGVAFVWDGLFAARGRQAPLALAAGVESHLLDRADAELLRALVLRHLEATDSRRAAALLSRWPTALRRVRKVAPAAATRVAVQPQAMRAVP